MSNDGDKYPGYLNANPAKILSAHYGDSHDSVYAYNSAYARVCSVSGGHSDVCRHGDAHGAFYANDVHDVFYAHSRDGLGDGSGFHSLDGFYTYGYSCICGRLPAKGTIPRSLRLTTTAFLIVCGLSLRFSSSLSIEG